MKQLNRYYRRSRISEKKFREITKCFALDLTANRTAQLTGLTHKSVNQIYLKIRRRLAEDCQRQSPFAGEIEVDESYFGARRARGKRMSALPSTYALITAQTNLLVLIQISMVSKVFGRLANDDWKNSMALRKILFICT